jgi:hypothetical protein
MGRRAFVVGLAALSVLVLPGVATAAMACKTVSYEVRSKPHWIWVAKTHKVHGHTAVVRRHGKIVYVHVRVSYVVKHKKVCTTAPGATSTPASPASVVTLHAHLDPSFTRSPTNPLAVVYIYNADATETIGGVTSPARNLPDGVLNLYSECAVTYTTTGVHTVITTYTSGSLSATETYTAKVEPFTTTTTLTIGGPFTCPGEPAECAAYSVSASAVDQNGNPVSPVWLSFFYTTPKGEQKFGNPIELPHGISTVEVRAGETDVLLTANPGGVIGSSTRSETWSVSAEYSGAGGWSASQSAPQTISP